MSRGEFELKIGQKFKSEQHWKSEFLRRERKREMEKLISG
jgi:hypothetical protein